MLTNQSNAEKAKAIVNLLPRKNCGKCGFENCGKFALAAIGGEASPFGCRQDSSAGEAICKILGIEAVERNGVAAGSVERPLGGHGHGRGHGGHHGEGHSLGHHGHHRMHL